ncbi:molecular chaperone [Dechloromonas sp. ARDL1]|uniref:TorD/DmsD family molecular chaperone n=1 Tax=Dechloromonas sp. ARDL1 TaxID=3322121 RepID=UPI003DA70BED
MENELFVALADDLDQLIRLHDRELEGALIGALRSADFPHGLALPPAGDDGRAAYANMADALNEEESLDELAADFAAIYLNNSLGASPYESVWLSDDHLACAAPMFELRELYAAAGLQAVDWRNRFDDHFVLQLQYLRLILVDPTVDLKSAAAFIDEHLGYWFPDFAQRVSMQCGTRFYAALVELTHVWLLRFRRLLDEVYDLPIPSREQMAERINRKLVLDKVEVAPIRFMPGAAGPSW